MSAQSCRRLHRSRGHEHKPRCHDKSLLGLPSHAVLAHTLELQCIFSQHALSRGNV